jgi:hypothetical protein
MPSPGMLYYTRPKTVDVGVAKYIVGVQSYHQMLSFHSFRDVRCRFKSHSRGSTINIGQLPQVAHSTPNDAGHCSTRNTCRGHGAVLAYTSSNNGH